MAMDSSYHLLSSSCLPSPEPALLRKVSSPTNTVHTDPPLLFSATQLLRFRCSSSISIGRITERRQGATFRRLRDTESIMSLSRREKNVGVSRSVSGGQSEYYNNNTDDVQEGDAANVDTEIPLLQRISEFQDAFWRFLRPHTIRGTIIGTTAVVIRALIDNSHLIDWGLLPKALCGLLALLCGNGYIVGINQIYDIGIDKVNKPFLPVASGDLSVPAAWTLVIIFAIVGISIVATNFGPLISGLYTLGLFLGAIYSVPPLRLKRFAVPAFLIIATVRGFLLNFGVYYATRSSLGLKFAWSPPIMFITFFVTLFATVIAITKDLPDVEGDRKFKISTFATKLGVQNIAFLGSGLLLVNYFGAMVAAYLFPQVFRRGIMVISHAVLASALIYQTWLLDASKYTKEGIATYYRFIWNLFYAEYALFPWI